jgi:predicted Zn finger-like uncharacterized protein
MLIVCPSCATSYMIAPGSLGPAGRMVRCARCKTAWFASGPKARMDVSGFVETVTAEAEGREPPSTRSPQHTAPDDFAEDHGGTEPPPPFGKRHEAPYAEQAEFDSAHPASHRAREPIPVSDAPSLVPPIAHDPLPPPRHAEVEVEDIESFAVRRARVQAKRKIMRHSSKWMAVILVLFGFNVALVGARNEVVRFVPQTASLFAAIGLPVNLRYPTLENVKISREENDGVSVLVVEGSIVSDASKAVEVPRMRFAVRNVSGQEIYSWTALPTRSILGPGETLPFRSRLASPPADASDVVVRFFTTRDTMPGTK